MSGATARRVGRQAAEAATGAAWAQWISLGAAVSSNRTPAFRAVVDPEALVLVSLAMSETERRLWDILGGWAHEGVHLLSVQRMQTLAPRFPEETRGRLRDFARLAVEAGDRRWGSLARNAAGASAAPRGKPFGRLRLVPGTALMLRLRAGLGVGSKADVLTYLLADGGAPRSVKDAVFATGYTDRAVRTALEEMARAGFVAQSAGRPATYAADPVPWSSLLGLAVRGTQEDRTVVAIPRWRAWSSVYAFLVAASEWAREAEVQAWSEYVAGSRARTLVEQHAAPLRLAGFGAAVPARTTDAAWFAALVEDLAGWIEAGL